MDYVGTVLIELTNRCSLACKYCYFPKTSDKDASEEILRGSIDFALSLEGEIKEIAFIGAEPLSRVDLIKKAVVYGESQAKKIGKLLTFGFTTNGVLLNEEIISFLISHGLKINLSIDGNTLTNKRNRGNIINFEKIKKLLQYENFAARMTVTPKTAKSMVENVDYLTDKGFKTIQINRELGVLWEKKCSDEFESEFDVLLEKFDYYKQKGVTIHNINCAQQNKEQKNCPMGRRSLSINHRGDVYPCYFLFYTKEDHQIGNIYDGVEGQKNQWYKDYLICNNDKKICNDCQQSELCTKMCLRFDFKDFSYNKDILESQYKLERNILTKLEKFRKESALISPLENPGLETKNGDILIQVV